MDFGLSTTFAGATPSAFVDPAAVEAWDAWFRWRDGNNLRDITIDGTWSRVIGALCALDNEHCPHHQAAVTEAIRTWRLLVDARILAGAGRPDFTWPEDTPRASINLAGFVSNPFSPRAALQTEALSAAVLLALRLLDDICATHAAAATAPRLGFLGLADALSMLHVDYRSDTAASLSAHLARQLAAAVLTGSSELASARGNRADTQWRTHALQRARRLELPQERQDQIRSSGLRFAAVLAVDPQPRLALFANNVADGLSPLSGAKQSYVIAGPSNSRRVVASGYAITLWQALNSATHRAFPFSTAAQCSELDNERIRAAVNPWLEIPLQSGEPASE